MDTRLAISMTEVMGIPIWGIVALVAGVIAFFWFIGAYNGLVSWRNTVRNAWSQIDVQLKRRYDLIPNLVNVVKGYAKHETEILDKVTQAIGSCLQAATREDQINSENVLAGALRPFLMLTTKYPDLKANENFKSLSEELTSTENKIAFSRQFYNDSVMKYNTKLESFPTNMIAGMFSFKQETYWQTPEPERGPVKVEF